MMLGGLLWLHPCVRWYGVWPALDIEQARADTLQYSYDARGRLIEIVDGTTNRVVEYSYDGNGNLTAVTPVTSATLSIAGLSSTQGSVGTQITIIGTGFSGGTTGQNTVSFNGAPASIVSSTSSQLVVTVPAGATSGSISVTTRRMMPLLPPFVIPILRTVSISNFTVTGN
jgi:YD repeat-containing protein